MKLTNLTSTPAIEWVLQHGGLTELSETIPVLFAMMRSIHEPLGIVKLVGSCIKFEIPNLCKSLMMIKTKYDIKISQ